MKNTKVELIPLTEDDREQFILDNQWAFKHVALFSFCFFFVYCGAVVEG